MKKREKIQISGEQLVEDFRTAMILLSTAEFAKNEAQRSERETVDNLSAMSSGNFLNPSFLPEETQTNIARSSVDAHIKKVQAAQIQDQSSWQLSDIQNGSNKYIGKNVTVTVLDRESKPIEALWQDEQTGEYYPSLLNTKGISGKIEEIMFDKNAIMLKIVGVSRLVTPRRHFYAVYVINPENGEPMVNLVF